MRIIYIDPGTGSMLISATIAMASVAFFIVKGFIYRRLGFSGNKGETVNLETEYDIVFYSEGKQYWNVFKDLVIGSVEAGLPVVYFTSDKEDPGLLLELDGFQSYYIGSGREAFYILNRLRCNILIMTTPGLDVLEIKRSPHVKHYCHLSHATSSVAGYKAYGVDYFDSVLIGGIGDVDVIRELESVRGLPAKDIRVIGQPYLDVLREKLDTLKEDTHYFNNSKPTVLISPTWGNHGLLTKVGDSLLNEFDESDEFNVIIRPHPQSFISDKELMTNLMNKYPNNKQRIWDRDRENLKSMAQADLMISDFSGIIFDFFVLFKKPILTMHEQYEKRGRDASDLLDDPWDIKILESIGQTFNESDIDKIIEITHSNLDYMSVESSIDSSVLDIIDKFPQESKERGMAFIHEKHKEISQEAVSVNERNDVVFENTLNFDLLKDRNIKTFIQSFFNSSSLLQYTMTSILLLFMMLLGLKVLPSNGLNESYIRFLLPFLIIMSSVIAVLTLLRIKINKSKVFTYQKKSESPDAIAVLFITLPMTPIVQYIISNQDILGFSDSLKVIGFFLLFCLLFVNVIPHFLSSVLSKSLSQALMTSSLFILFNMASFGRSTSYPKINIIFFVCFIIIFLISYFNRKRVLSFIFTLVLIVNSLSSLINKPNEEIVIDENSVSESELLAMVKDKKVINKPSVYLLVYDSYENQETLEKYGFNNSEQMDYLLNDGFAIYDGTYSLGANSLNSMSTVLHAGEVLETPEETRRILAKDASSTILFSSLDYTSQFIFDSDYFVKGYETIQDFIYPDAKLSIESSKIIISAILEGEFRFDADFSAVTYEDFLRVRATKLNEKKSNPVYFYAHDNYPGHSQNSGVLLPNETELHLEKLKFANHQMKENIESIRKNDENAVIVVFGDHGPYLTKNGIGLHAYDSSEINQLDIQDRYGTFLAISWPDKSYVYKYDIKTIQDIIPAIASYMYEDDAIFDATKMTPSINKSKIIGGLSIVDGLIVGGPDDGKPLFDRSGVRFRE
ncbi:CDP-glycerol glycerophosphotransferase family protein [Erysipelothrix urinaevulpis]|uniref:CDP-glycerol glycerophosphotransferase family protein n=1 Tax=Erysipelothrix urinaevulpis TaxID=2683717 RepID=UPI00135AACE8|nr:CDP-glycerol glycerophosphotransferase family protein [Erysipelothrix urinaevulpis]